MSSPALVPRAPIRRTLRRLRPLGFVAIGLALLVLVIATFVAVYTNWLWFDSVHESSVYGRRLLTQVVMFVLFGGATAVATAAVIWGATRLAWTVDGGLPWLRAKWRALTSPVRRLLLAAVPTIAGLRAGFAAAAHWQLWLLWKNAVPFGRADPQFHRDDSYYVDVLPFHRYVDSVLVSILTISIVAFVVIAYLRGAVRLRGARPRTTPAFRVGLSVLLAVLAVVKAGGYWLDRFSTVTSSRGPVTGQSWTDLHVVLPMKLVLLAIALVLVVVFAFAAWRRSLGLALAGVLTMVAAGVVFGGVVPWLFQTFKAKPSAISAEATSITRNIAATQYGFGLDATTTPMPASGKPTVASVGSTLQPRLDDPNVVTPTFRQQQQLAAYYQFKGTLDVDRYSIDGRSTDVVIGVRELNQNGLPRKTWTNQHLVYTHGIGVVAAPTDSSVGKAFPNYLEQGIPSHGALAPSVQDRIYFGQYSPSYSIVGAPTARGKEFDQPGEGAADYAYAGDGGVPIASVWHRLLYALRFGDKNILFASGFNADSQLLYRRNPAARVNAVAPWLTVDGDVYPVVAGNHVTWIADAYTTSSTLPDSQQVNLRSATTTTYTKYGAMQQQASTAVNYMRNSVVATVDAYTGAVTLYQKPGAPADPLLRAWMRAFPGLVKPASAIPSYLLPHLRYPEDLFNVQRAVLAKYHGESASAFYAGNQFWKIPSDPSAPTTKNLPPQPSYYATAQIGGQSHFALTSPLLSNNRSNIAAYLTVDCDEGTPGYGRLLLTTVPASVPTTSPAQLQNSIESDPNIAQQLTLLRGGQSKVTIGNLQTYPVAGQVLAVEPVYTRQSSGQSYPLLRDVIVVFGDNNPGFAPSFTAALAQTLGISNASANTQSLLAQAQQALTAVGRAQANGDTSGATAAESRLARILQELSNR